MLYCFTETTKEFSLFRTFDELLDFIGETLGQDYESNIKTVISDLEIDIQNLEADICGYQDQIDTLEDKLKSIKALL